MAKRKYWHLIALFIVLLVLLVHEVIQGAAQVSFGRIYITNVSTELFPEVRVQAIIRDEKGGVVSDKDIVNLELLENQRPVDFTVETVEGAVEVMIVMDLGPNLDRNGAVTLEREGGTARRATRLEEMFDIALAFLDSMRLGDSAGIITVGAFQQPQVVVLQSLTTEKELLRSKLASLAGLSLSNQPSRAVQALDEALSALQNSQVIGKNAIQAVLLISDGNVHNFASPNFAAVLERAQRLGIPIHTVLVHEYDVMWSSAKLKEIARETNGEFVFYQSAGDRQKFPEWANAQRAQSLFIYRSPIGATKTRKIELRTKGTGIAQKVSVATYEVNLLSPEIVIQEPIDGTTIRRTYSEGETVEAATPKSVNVVANIRWPDGYPRVIQWAKLIVSGDSRQEIILPYPGGDTYRFTVDLTPFTREAAAEAQIWVEVAEELLDETTNRPLTYMSPPSKIYVAVQPPNIQEKGDGVGRPLSCAEVGGVGFYLCLLQQYAWLISLSLSFVALLLVVVFRSRIATVAVQVGDAVRETVARITRPQKTEVGAYLQVLRGAEDLPRNRFPLYLNTVTPIGRDKRQADLIFDEYAEQSVVSRLHCEIIEEGGIYTIRDKGSTHGTYVNGKRLPELGSVQLQDGDQIEIGPVERGGILLRFEVVHDEIPSSRPELSSLQPEQDIADRETRPML